MAINSVSTSGALAAMKAQFTQAAAGLPAAGRAAESGGADFVTSLQSALKAVSETQQQASATQRQFQLENPNVSLEETMIAMNKAQISFAAAVQVRNRLVQAYEQVMNMPV